MERASMRLSICSLRRGTLALGHGGKEGIAHHHLVLLGLLGVGHNVGDAADEEHGTADASNQGQDDEGS